MSAKQWSTVIVNEKSGLSADECTYLDLAHNQELKLAHYAAWNKFWIHDNNNGPANVDLMTTPSKSMLAFIFYLGLVKAENYLSFSMSGTLYQVFRVLLPTISHYVTYDYQMMHLDIKNFNFGTFQQRDLENISTSFGSARLIVPPVSIHRLSIVRYNYDPYIYQFNIRGVHYSKVTIEKYRHYYADWINDEYFLGINSIQTNLRTNSPDEYDLLVVAERDATAVRLVKTWLNCFASSEKNVSSVVTNGWKKIFNYLEGKQSDECIAARLALGLLIVKCCKYPDRINIQSNFYDKVEDEFKSLKADRVLFWQKVMEQSINYIAEVETVEAIRRSTLKRKMAEEREVIDVPIEEIIDLTSPTKKQKKVEVIVLDD